MDQQAIPGREWLNGKTFAQLNLQFRLLWLTGQAVKIEQSDQRLFAFDVERVGTLNFPSAARRDELSGSPVIEVAIAADGRLLEAAIQRSSGQPMLDQAALLILRLASPFEPFPKALAKDYASLRFAYQWEFVAGQVGGGAVTAGTNGGNGP